MEFRILGELEVLDDAGQVIDVVGYRRRALVALLATHPNETVSADRLVDALWEDETPANAANALQAVVSRVRRAVGDARILTRAPGYALRTGPDELDADRFERLAGEARRAFADGDPHGAVASFRQALGLWRGPALAEFAYARFAQVEAARLEERRLAVLEERIEAELALGGHGELVAELEALATAHPLRERLQGQRLLALYRAGRQADALARYRELRVPAARRARDRARRGAARARAGDPAARPRARSAGRPGARRRATGQRATIRSADRRLVSIVYVELGEIEGPRPRAAAHRAAGRRRRARVPVHAARRKRRGAARRRGARGLRARAGARGRRGARGAGRVRRRRRDRTGGRPVRGRAARRSPRRSASRRAS